MKDIGVLGWLALVLAIVGALNWGLVGFFDFNLVSALFGTMTMFSRVVYALVGLGALYSIFALYSHNQHHH